MTMVTKMNASTFKAKCLALLDEVAETGREVVITKRGKPIARVVPLDTRTEDDALARLRGSLVECPDDVEGFDTGVEWEAGRG